ncbi:MAG: phage major capsid protein, P2 family [Hafnia sp.]
MRNTTQDLFDKYIQRQAELNGISAAHVTKGYSIDPSVEQTLEDKIQQSSEMLKLINMYGVNDQTGEKIGLGVSGPVSSTNNSTTDRRQPTNLAALDSNKYTCNKVNADTFTPYTQLDAWAKFPDFQQRLSNQIIKRIALDRIMIGFNGTSYAEKSDRAANPLLQDCGIGWLQQYRTNAPQRVMKNITVTSRDDTNQVIAKGDYGNYDSVVFDGVNSLMDEWYKDSPDLVVITGRNLTVNRSFPIINAVSTNNPNSEALAGQLIASRKTIGNLPSFIAPFFPDGSMFITSWENLSIYWQEGGHRRRIVEEPEYNRVSTYSSSNDAYVIEDYGYGCLIEGITAAEPAPAP